MGKEIQVLSQEAIKQVTLALEAGPQELFTQFRSVMAEYCSADGAERVQAWVKVNILCGLLAQLVDHEGPMLHLFLPLHHFDPRTSTPLHYLFAAGDSLWQPCESTAPDDWAI